MKEIITQRENISIVFNSNDSRFVFAPLRKGSAETHLGAVIEFEQWAELSALAALVMRQIPRSVTLQRSWSAMVDNGKSEERLKKLLLNPVNWIAEPGSSPSQRQDENFSFLYEGFKIQENYPVYRIQAEELVLSKLSLPSGVWINAKALLTFCALVLADARTFKEARDLFSPFLLPGAGIQASEQEVQESEEEPKVTTDSRPTPVSNILKPGWEERAERTFQQEVNKLLAE